MRNVINAHEHDYMPSASSLPSKGIYEYIPDKRKGPYYVAFSSDDQTNTVFLKLTGPQFVQTFIRDYSKLIFDAFELTKEADRRGGGTGGHNMIQ